MNKKFSKKLLDKHDKATKKVVIDNLPRLLCDEYPGLVLFENGNKYGIDLVGVTAAEKVICVEVEHKLAEGWDGPQYPYEDVRIPERKRKFALGEDETLFVVLNFDFTQMAVITAEDLLASKVIKMDTRYGKREDFFCVPWEDVRFFQIGKEEEVHPEGNQETGATAQGPGSTGGREDSGLSTSSSSQETGQGGSEGKVCPDPEINEEREKEVNGKAEESSKSRHFRQVQNTQPTTGQGQPEAQSGQVQRVWRKHEKRGL